MSRIAKIGILVGALQWVALSHASDAEPKRRTMGQRVAAIGVVAGITAAFGVLGNDAAMSSFNTVSPLWDGVHQFESLPLTEKEARAREVLAPIPRYGHLTGGLLTYQQIGEVAAAGAYLKSTGASMTDLEKTAGRAAYAEVSTMVKRVPRWALKVATFRNRVPPHYTQLKQFVERASSPRRVQAK